jgi:hypothetical protein
MSVSDNIFNKLIKKLLEQDIPLELIEILKDDWLENKKLSSQTIKEFLDDVYGNQN